MKKTTKLMLGALTAASVVAPIAAVVSCGSKTSDPNKITFAMRAEDFDLWKPIINEFKAKTGIDVDLRITSNGKSDYSLWQGAGQLPDVCLADQNLVRYAQDQDWFQKLDLADLGDAKYSISETPKAFNFKDASQFYQPALSSVNTTDGKVWAVPYGLGKQGIWYNANHTKTGAHLFAYMPKKDGSFAKVDLGVEATFENVQKFIANSGKAAANDEAIGSNANDTAIEAALKTAGADAGSEWFDNGPAAMYQRIASVALSVAKDDSTFGWAKDAGFAFEIAASAGHGIYDGTQIKDDVLKTVFPADASAYKAPTGATLDGVQKFFYSYLGYFRGKSSGTADKGYASTPKAQGEPGEAELMWKNKGTILLGYKWQAGMIRDNWSNAAAGQTFDNSMKVIPAPYGSIGEDTLAISSDVSGDKLDNVKKFLRFALTEAQNGFAVTGGKVVSPFMASEKIQEDQLASIADSEVPKNETKANFVQRQQAFFKSGNGIQDANGLAGGIVATSTSGLYDIYNQSGDGGLKTLADGSYRGTFDEMLKAFGETMDATKRNIALQGGAK